MQLIVILIHRVVQAETFVQMGHAQAIVPLLKGLGFVQVTAIQGVIQVCRLVMTLVVGVHLSVTPVFRGRVVEVEKEDVRGTVMALMVHVLILATLLLTLYVIIVIIIVMALMPVLLRVKVVRQAAIMRYMAGPVRTVTHVPTVIPTVIPTVTEPATEPVMADVMAGVIQAVLQIMALARETVISAFRVSHAFRGVIHTATTDVMTVRSATLYVRVA